MIFTIRSPSSMDLSKSESEMSTLPYEIKEYILTKLDGISLMKMRLVSKEWKEILDNPKQTLLKKWEQVCKSEIDSDSLRNILDKLEPKHHISSKGDLWKNAYNRWFYWSHLNKWNVTQTKLHSFANCEISCITVSGEWLIIGTRNYGSVVALKYHSKVTELLFLGANVTDLRPYTVTGEHPLLEGLAHDKLILEFEHLMIGDLDLHALGVTFLDEPLGRRQFHHFENKEIKIDVSTERSIITLSRLQEKEINKIEMIGYWSIEHCWTNRNLLSCTKGYYIVTDDDFVVVDNHPFTYLTLLHSDEPSIKHFFGGSVIISVNKKQYCNHEMIVRVLNKQKLYMPFNSLSHHVSSILYYGMNLFLGSDLGNVYVYHTKNILGLLHLDLCAPSVVWEFGNEPIISITLKETNKKPFIWVASNCHIYQVNFL